jgi:hypothetical protein
MSLWPRGERRLWRIGTVRCGFWFMRSRLLAFPYDKDGAVPPEVHSAEGLRSYKPRVG